MLWCAGSCPWIAQKRWEWLIQEGFLGKGSLRMPQNQRTAYGPASSHQSERPRPGEPPPANGYQLERLAARFHQLRERAVSAEGTPARAYLPPDGWPGPSTARNLPGSVRWIAADAFSDVLCWPAEAMPGGEWAGHCGFPLQRRAPSLEARSTRGQRAASDRTKPGPGAAGGATWAKSRACASRHRTAAAAGCMCRKARSQRWPRLSSARCRGKASP